MASRIAGITVEINGETTALSKSLEGVNKTIKTTQSELKDVERLLKLDPKNTELLSQKQEKLATNIKNTKEKLDALKTAQEQAKTQMENGDLGKDKYEALQREIVATEEELKKLAKEAADSNEALNKLESAGKTMENVGNKISSVGSTLTKTVTVPIAAIGTAAVKTTADFDSSMSNVAAISGATGEDFDSLRDKAREMGAKTKFSASEAADAMSYMAMAGWKTGDMLDGIEGIMYLAAASGEDLATSSDIVTDALTAMGYSAADSGRLADVMAAASSNANTNVSLMGETFKYAAAVAGSYGYSMEDTALATGLMANAGIKGTQAGTALRSIMSRLATDAGASSTSLGALGILTQKLGVEFYNADGSMRPFRDVILDTRKAWNGLTQEEQANYANKIAGKNAMSGWLALMNASETDVNKLATAIDNCDGTAESMANTMQDNLNGQITILKSQLQELAIQIGDALMPTIRDIVSKIQDFVAKLSSMDEGTRNTIIKIALFAAAIGPLLLVFGKMTSGIGKVIQNIASMGKGILNFVNQAKLGVGAGGKFASAIAAIGPVGWAVIAVVAALTAAFVHLWKNNEEFREKITAVWDGIKEKFSAAGQQITDAINSLGFDFDNLGEAIKAAWDWFCNALAPIVVGIVQTIGTVLGGIIDVVTGIVQVICGIIKGFKDGDWTLFLDGLKNIWTGIWNVLSAPVQLVINVITGYLEKAGTTWGEVWEGVKTFFTNIWTAIKDFFVGIWDAIKNTVVTVVTAIGDAVSTGFNAVKTTFENIWNGIVTVVTTVWETIKSVVQVGIMFIGELFSAAVQIITLPFRFIWENCKDIIIEVWDAIKEKVSAALDAIKGVIETVWNGIKEFMTPILDAIKTAVKTAWEGIKTVTSTVFEAVKGVVTTVWEAIKTAVTTVVDAIKTAVSSAWDAIKTVTSTAFEAVKTVVSTIWEGIKTVVTTVVDAIKTTVSTVFTAISMTVSTIWNGIKTTTSTVWNAIKTAVSTPINAIKSTISTVFNSIKSTATTTWNAIKNAITTPINAAKTAVQNAIDAIKRKFNFTWSLPKLKLPHVSITGSFSLKPPRVPHFSVSWYKKAMDNGMILNSPTIFGMKGNSLLAGGEAGSETVVGTKSLLSMIEKTVNAVAGGATYNYGGVNVNVYAAAGQDEMAIAQNVADIIKNQVGRESVVWA